MNSKLAEKLYKDAINKAKDEMSDELFLGFYRKGQLTSDDMTKDAWEIHLEAIKEMALDKSFGNCERAYSVSIDNIKTDIEDILKNWTIDVAALEVGSIFYTLEINNSLVDVDLAKMYNIYKWKVTGTKEYERSFRGSRKIFECSIQDYGSIRYGEDNPEEGYFNNWCFTDEELLKEARDTDEFFLEQKNIYETTDSTFLKQQESFAECFKILEGLDDED